MVGTNGLVYVRAMADPTLKDVLDAIDALATTTKGDLARLEANVARVETDLAQVAAHVARLQADVTAHRAETTAHRAETKKGFADLDEELTRHTAVHREKDITALKRRPPRTAARPSRRR